MHRTLGIFAGLVASLALASANAQSERPLTPPASLVSPESRVAKPIALSSLFQSPTAYGATWSSDGKSIIFTSNEGGRPNLWMQPLPSGPARQLSRSEQAQFLATTSRQSAGVIYQSDKDGHELYDLYVLSPATGESRQLTNTPDIDESRALVSADGQLIAFSHRLKTGDSANVAVMAADSSVPRVLTQETGTGLQWTVAAISRDGRYLIANRNDWSYTVSEAYRITIATGAAVRLTPEGVYAQATDLSPDGRFVAIYLDTKEGVRQAALLDAASHRVTMLSPGPWEQTSGKFSPDGKSLLFSSNEDGRDQVYEYDVRRKRAAVLPLPVGLNDGAQFSFDGTRILFAHASGSEPLDYWVFDRKSKTAAKATSLGRVQGQALPRTQIVHYRSRDGLVISALMWMPFNLKRDGGAPAVVLAHGGPTGQVRDSFDPLALALASRGFVVLAPNFRGSTGYGKAFLEANVKDLGGGDLQDLVDGTSFLVESGYVDAKRIGISGGSYGGYLTMMALGRTPDSWAAGAEMFGIVNWKTMWELGAPQNRRYQKTLLGDPAEQPEGYRKSSPLTYLDQVKAPLLVLHGENDIRVPLPEAKQVVKALQDRGAIVDSRIYAAEGHGFRRMENRIDALERIVAWFDRYLKPQSSALPPASAASQ